MKKFIILCTLLIASASANFARADEEGASLNGNLTATAGPAKKGPLAASYMSWLSGPKVGALDGMPGEGKNLTLKHYATVGYRLDQKTRLAFSQYFTNPMKSGPGNDRELVFLDPYVTLSSSRLRFSFTARSPAQSPTRPLPPSATGAFGFIRS